MSALNGQLLLLCESASFPLPGKVELKVGKGRGMHKKKKKKKQISQTKLGLMASNMEGNDVQNKILGEQN